MTTLEFRPQHDPHRRPSYRSEVLKRNITPNAVERLSKDDMNALFDELQSALGDVNVQLTAAIAERAEGHIGLPAAEFSRLQAQRTLLGALHQRCCQRRSAIRKELQATTQAELDARKKQQAEDELNPLTVGKPTSYHFQQVCRQELDAATYQRLVLMAEARRNRELSQILMAR